MRKWLESMKECIKGKLSKIHPIAWIKSVFNKLSLKAKIIISGSVLIIGVLAVLLGTGVIDLNPLMPESYLLQKGLTKVPNVIGKDISAAEKMLADRQLDIQIVDKQYSDNVEEGMVLFQNVKKGEVLNTNDVIEITISAGPELVLMPDLLGYTKENAINILADNGIAAEVVEESGDYAPGVVIEQSASSAEKVQRGTIVKLTVSEGTADSVDSEAEELLFCMPDVQYKNEEVALEQLQNLGLNVETVFEENEWVRKGNVVSQSVAAYTGVSDGDEVTLVISLGNKEIDMAGVPQWSDWMTQLPEGITASDYEIENKKQYSFRDKFTMSSLETDISGWTQYDSLIVQGEFEPWSEWSTEKPVKEKNKEIEQKTQYAYSDYETTTLLDQETYQDWTLVGEPEITYEFNEWGDWSEWSTEQPEEGTYREIEQKTQYQSQHRTWEMLLDNPSLEGYILDESRTVVEYGEWSEWSETVAVASNTLEVESQMETREIEIGTTYNYFKWVCNGSISYREDYAEQMGRGNAEYSSTTSTKLFAEEGRTHVDPSTKQEWILYKDENGGLWFMGETTPIMGNEYCTVYRSRTVTTTYWFYQWSDWSDWGDDIVKSNEDTNVNERTVYSFREQIPHYHCTFEHWTPYSEFSDEEIAESKTRKVQTQTVYQYREREQITIFDYYKWGAWSDWRDEKIKASDSREVQQQVLYRYREK